MKKNSNNKSYGKIIAKDKQDKTKRIVIKSPIETFNKKINPRNNHRPKPDTDTEDTRGLKGKI